MSPPFDERDIDLYLCNFDKLANAQGWPKAQWSAVLIPLLKGAKGSRAMNRLRQDQMSNYGVLKGNQFDRWLNSVGAMNDVDVLKNVLLQSSSCLRLRMT